MNRYKQMATQGALGYSTAPGTYATLWTMPLVWWMTHMGLAWYYYLMLSSVLWLLATYVVARALSEFQDADPAEIVLDEMTSFPFVFLGLIPSYKDFFCGFVLFRLLDIYKPCGIKRLEAIGGAWGIMLDDLCAAVCSCVLLHVVHYLGLW